MKKIFYTLVLATLSFVAIPALAAATTFKELVNGILIGGILRPLVPLLIGLAVVLFIYGVIITMLSEGGDKKEEGKQFMIWGIVGIFVMVSVWGLVNILKDTFDLNENVPKIEIKLK